MFFVCLFSLPPCQSFLTVTIKLKETDYDVKGQPGYFQEPIPFFSGKYWKTSEPNSIKPLDYQSKRKEPLPQNPFPQTDLKFEAARMN